MVQLNISVSFVRYQKSGSSDIINTWEINCSTTSELRQTQEPGTKYENQCWWSLLVQLSPEGCLNMDGLDEKDNLSRPPHLDLLLDRDKNLRTRSCWTVFRCFRYSTFTYLAWFLWPTRQADKNPARSPKPNTYRQVRVAALMSSNAVRAKNCLKILEMGRGQRSFAFWLMVLLVKFI